MHSATSIQECECKIFFIKDIEIVLKSHFWHENVIVTSCFVYKVMGLTFHDRIRTQLIYRFELAQVVTWRITKPQRFFLMFESHWLLFFVQFFFRGGGGGSDFIIIFMSYFLFLINLLFFFFTFFFVIPLTCIRHINIKHL